MPILPVTSVTAAIFAVMIVALAFQVSLRRARLGGVTFGDGGDKVLQRQIRAHGNFIEYAPFALACIALLELQAAPRGLVATAGICFVSTRLLHALGMLYAESPVPRAIAMLVQHLAFIAVGAYLAFLAIRA